MICPKSPVILKILCFVHLDYFHAKVSFVTDICYIVIKSKNLFSMTLALNNIWQPSCGKK